MRYWLLKSEPESFSIDDFAGAKGKTTCWDGVRNYQARNMLRDDIKKGDKAFLYQSSCAVPGIAGVMTVTRGGYPDHTQFDASHPHHDPESRADAPRWYMVDVKLERKLQRIITLEELRAYQHKNLKDLLILKRGNRLSVTPVTREEWEFILALE